MKVLLITGGRIDDDFARTFCARMFFDRVIAADRGLETADQMPQLPLSDIVGDFDSVCPQVLQRYVCREDIVVHRFCPEKDYTDTDLALKLAVDFCLQAHEESEIWILGATGTRLDHVLANIELLMLPLRKRIPAYIQDAHNRICLLSDSLMIRRENRFGRYLSLLPLNGDLTGVCLYGVKYPLQDYVVHVGESLCVSNEITADIATLSVKSGIAVVIQSAD